MKKKWLIFILVILFYSKTSFVLAQIVPTPTPMPTLSPTLTPTSTTTPSAAPVTANFTPTLFVFGAGVLLMIIGLVVIF